MNTMEELPNRCDHPLEFVTLEYATERQMSGGAYVADAILHCHKCKSKFHLCSDYSGRYDHKDHLDVPIMNRCTL